MKFNHMIPDMDSYIIPIHHFVHTDLAYIDIYTLTNDINTIDPFLN